MDYRAYILADEGRITGVHELDWANDDEATRSSQRRGPLNTTGMLLDAQRSHSAGFA
jgi:hypothetical protein